MAEAQPQSIVEGATTVDIEDELPPAAKSAEDRKAAAALSSLDAARDDESVPVKSVDQEAVKKAMDRLAGTGSAGVAQKKTVGEEKETKKAIKIDPASLSIVVEELELSKIKATELLRLHDGDATKAIRAYVTAAV